MSILNNCDFIKFRVHFCFYMFRISFFFFFVITDFGGIKLLICFKRVKNYVTKIYRVLSATIEFSSSIIYYNYKNKKAGIFLVVNEIKRI